MGSQGSNISSGRKLRLCSDCVHVQTGLNLAYEHSNLYLMVDTEHAIYGFNPRYFLRARNDYWC